MVTRNLSYARHAGFSRSAPWIVTVACACGVAGCASSDAAPSTDESASSTSSELKRSTRPHLDRDDCSITGAWLVASPSDSSFHALSTFEQGGTFSASPINPLVTDAHGVWRATESERAVQALFMHLRRDATGAFAGMIRQEGIFTMGGDCNTFTGSVTSFVLDAKGKLVHSDKEPRSGVRLAFPAADGEH